MIVLVKLVIKKGTATTTRTFYGTYAKEKALATYYKDYDMGNTEVWIETIEKLK